MSATPLNPLTFPLHGARLIEASAGTGKTWTIAALYVRLVLGHGDAEAGFGRPLLPPEILVVTFTEAATKELRDRIRRRLTEAARCFRGQGQADGFLRELIKDYGEAGRSACARRLEVAAQWMDEAAVYTIHSWCNRMLRQHAFDSASLFDLEVEAQDAELLHEVARDYWRCFFYPLDEAASLAVAQLAGNPKALLEQVQDLLRETEADWRDGGQVFEQTSEPEVLLGAWAEWDAGRQTLERRARGVWDNDRDTLEQWLRKASAEGWLNGTSYPAKNFEARLQALAAWARTGEACDPKWLAGFGQSRIKLNKKYQAKLLAHPAFAALDELADHLEQQPSFKREILVHAARWMRRRFAEEKQTLARMDFNDLLTHLDQALQRPAGARLAQAICQQYPVALIDEFQDTDPVQYRIFAAVYAQNANTGVQGSACMDDSSRASLALHAKNPVGFFMIGDPKQAIYAFRGADIFTYLRARTATQGRHYTLQRNFRSTGDLAAAVNRVFAHAEAWPDGAFRFKPESGENPLPFYPVLSQGRDEQLWIDRQPATALTLWHLANDDGATAMGDYRKTMAERAAGEITRLLNLAGQGKAGFKDKQGWQALKPADIAILVRSRTEATAIRQALAQRDLRSVYLSDRESVYGSAEAGDLLHWLNACADPVDRKLKAALGTATLDLSYAHLETLNREELAWEEEVRRFWDYRKIWRQQGVLPMLRRLMTDFSVPARLLQTADGERRLTNLLHLAELLQAASVELDGEQALIRYLAETRSDESQAADEALLRLESDADLIKVVTIHKSKGLEYPLVFLPFICSFRETTGKQPYYRFHDAQGRLQIDLGKTKEGKEQAERERLQEDLRLLYVALTRAVHACWLGIAPIKVGNTENCQLHKSAVGHVLNGGEAIASVVLGEKLKALRGDCAAIQITPPPELDNAFYQPVSAELALEDARRFAGRATERWWIASYSALKLQAEGEEAAPSDRLEAPDTPRQANLEEAAGEDSGLPPGPDSGMPTMHRFPRGAKPGTFLHGLLEWAARTGFAKAAGEDAIRRDTIARRCRTRGWTDWVDTLNDWLKQMLSSPMALPYSRAALADLGAYQPELEFWLASERVDTPTLDRLVTRYTLDAALRPKLSYDLLNGMLKGFMDLVFEHEGRYYVADYKSNWLGAEDKDYTAEAMRREVLEKRYELQYTLYLLALHRQLKVRLRGGYDYDRHIGGAVYIFLRGLAGPAGGAHLETPPRELIEGLDALFMGQKERDHAA